ncbi:hypothetical protein Y88_1960 [Novosphingobium nitrogenifigens DSM 19370]|uniref:Uncharacterized protein n=1 Tax=Novosphingobium nitrogenifigens DSM 19370 TaxID=983920 RepID=F1Z4Y3_9SPHN|nr:hypothetical protein Y88_1960 [Novosphingobium nitrogenifigens DSM 19370]
MFGQFPGSRQEQRRCHRMARALASPSPPSTATPFARPATFSAIGQTFVA